MAPGMQGMMESRIENKLFWPAVAAIAVILALRNLSRPGRLTLPPNIICLLAYLAFAGASVAWAFKPALSFTRFVQEVMVITSIVLPAMLAARSADMMRGLFLCFAFAAILNVIFILGGAPPITAKNVTPGHQGYFLGKNLLGEFAAAALLLALYEMSYPGFRRALGIIAAVTATSLLFLCNSKTAFGLAFLAPLLAGLTLMIANKMRISPAIVLLSIPLCYTVLTIISGFNASRLSYMLYGDPTFTGRTIIWDFVRYEIDRRPLLGWGYQSFWLVGSDGPSITDAPGWVKSMPEGHNGYYDTMLETGYVGFTLLIIFIVTTLHAIGRMANLDPTRAWLVLSLTLFVIIYNFLESMWMRGSDLLWVIFVIVAAEIARYWQSVSQARAAAAMGGPKSRRAQRGQQDGS
jgi:O-antigen ligase